MRLLFSVTIFLTSFIMQAMSATIDQRMQQDEELQNLNLSLLPYKPNYLFLYNYNENLQSYDVYQDYIDDSEQIQTSEVKFQISFKTPILVNVGQLPLSIFFGYTQVSYWQAYNSDYSSPFRETNYEPELFATWKQDLQLTDNWHFKVGSLNLTHQSNGQTGSLSRSWNRIESNLVFANNNLTVAFTPWYRFEEDSANDDNPDLTDYYGHGQISAVYPVYNNTFTLTTRNNIESGFSKGSVKLDWSFPLGFLSARGYLQVFSGYGNSLIGYNEYTNTIGVGISLTDWL